MSDATGTRDDVDDARTAARAAVAFGRVLRLMADETLAPSVMLHVTGLLGALLVHHSEYEFDDVFAQIRQTAEDREAVAGMHAELVQLGMLPADEASG